MLRKQPLGGVQFLECFEAYAANLQGAGAPMAKCDFNKDAEQQICWNHASARCSPVSLLCVFGTPYHRIVSEGLLSIHHGLQIHCIIQIHRIINVNICMKGSDDKTVVFYRSFPCKYYCEKTM